MNSCAQNLQHMLYLICRLLSMPSIPDFLETLVPKNVPRFKYSLITKSCSLGKSTPRTAWTCSIDIAELLLPLDILELHCLSIVMKIKVINKVYLQSCVTPYITDFCIMPPWYKIRGAHRASPSRSSLYISNRSGFASLSQSRKGISF